MIQGVNVINQVSEIHYTSTAGSLLLGLILLIFAICCTVGVISCIKELISSKKIKDKGSFITCILIGGLLYIASISILEDYFTRTEYKTTKYQITIDDTVRMKEFNDTYDVISHEGNVYIVTSKLEDEIKHK